ncbi:hypothetical protein TrVE_jg12032 [Triparma verrucosa]|uniref:Uncharacterized protein n=1 Tax=Triparma verrucosa TaxID=1606542 RepID=A0A9W7EZK9_9STRA|nr:hypothetical protein TrVE_jg12032 [Triparma verrucosa]
MEGKFHTDGSFYSGVNNTCSPDPEYDFDILVGLCRDESLPAADMMHCYRLEYSPETGLLEPDKNGTQYRCGCNKLFPLDGFDCLQPLENVGGITYFANVLFLIQLLISMILFWKAISGFIVIVLDGKAKKKKFDTVAATSLLLTFASVFTIIMVTSFCLRSSGLINNAGFDSFLFSFPFTVMFVCQCFNGLALAWLDVAIKSDKMEGGKSIPKYMVIKKFLKGFVVFLFIACGHLFLSDMTAFITILANLMGLIMSIALRIGGGRIYTMLKKSNDKKSSIVATAMKRTYSIMIWSQPLLLFAGIWYTMTYLSVQNNGIKLGWALAISVGLMTVCLHLSIWAMTDFVERVRVNAVKKVGADGVTMGTKSTTVSSAPSSMSSP